MSPDGLVGEAVPATVDDHVTERAVDRDEEAAPALDGGVHAAPQMSSEGAAGRRDQALAWEAGVETVARSAAALARPWWTPPHPSQVQRLVTEAAHWHSGVQAMALVPWWPSGRNASGGWRGVKGVAMRR
jgi:hypothetical protein